MNEVNRWRPIVVAVVLGLLAAAIAFALQPAPTVRGKSPAQPLVDELSAEQALAQELALEDERVQTYTVGRRSEVFGVHMVAQGHHPSSSAACLSADCRRVEIYNFDENVAITAIVNVDAREVLDVMRLPNMHPGINQRLINLAEDIAFNAPEVIDVLGFSPSAGDMAPVESNPTNTACNNGHLCGAITFELGDRVLWAIVDMTDEALAGIAFTDMEVTPPSVETAEPWDVEDCVVTEVVERDGWFVNHIISGSDGLVVYDVTYNGETVLRQAKLVEWHAAYPDGQGGYTGFVDATGCSPFGGFPIYPFGPTQVVDIVENSEVIGFEVIQDFRMSNWGSSCNYRYEQHYEFYADGRFRVVAGAYGKGCGDDAIYRPIVRMDVVAGGDDGGDTFARYAGGDWVEYATEAWYLDNGFDYSAEGYLYRLTDDDGTGFYLETGHGQFDDGGQGDHAYMYVTRHNPAEGDADLGAIGGCCNDDHQQGPHNYVNGESVAGEDIVLWYAAEMVTDVTPGKEYCWTQLPNTWPCFSGPMFHPMGDGDVVYISGALAQTVAGGVPYQANDILAYDTRTSSWSLLLDGATVGLPASANINAFVRAAPFIAMSFSAPTDVPGVGTVQPEDVVAYNTNTGNFLWLVDGSDVNLTGGDGGIDALGASADGRLLVSTGEPVQYDGVNTADDEDVLVFDLIQWGGNTQGSWSLYVDGSDLGLGGNDAYDVRGVYQAADTGDLYFTLENTFTDGIVIERADVAVCQNFTAGADTSCGTVAVYWQGAAAGIIGNIVIDGLGLDVAATAAPQLQGLSR